MKTVISLTTIPTRLPFIGPNIENLKTHGLPIYLWIPRVFKRRNIEFDGRIPNFCKGINVEVVEDEGPITKLLPALRAGFERIITYDDDLIYEKSTTDTFIKHSDKDPLRAYGGRGLSFYGFQYRNGKPAGAKKEPIRVSLIEGGWGALYMNSFFDESIFEEHKECPTNDDFVISAHLKRKGIPLMEVRTKIPTRTRLANHGDSLYRVNMDPDTKSYANDEYLKMPRFRVLVSG